MEEFQEQVPETVSFQCWLFRRASVYKKWICSQEDLEAMYKVCAAKSEILLWCDSANATATASDEDDCLPAKKKSRAKRECKEEEVEKVFSELQKKQDNTEKYTTPQLRLWARMVAGGLHTSTDDPPKITIFTGSSSSKEKPKSQLQEVLEFTSRGTSCNSNCDN